MLTFDKQKIEGRLGKVDFRQQLVVAALCVDRMLPFYRKFAEDEGWGDTEAVESILNTVFTVSIAGGQLEKDHLEDMISVCIANTPDSDEFPSALASCAQDVMVGLYHCLKYANLRQSSDVADVLLSAVSLVDLYVQEVLELSPSDEEREDKIESNPLMQIELSYQEADVTLAEQGLLLEQVAELRQRRLIDEILI